MTDFDDDLEENAISKVTFIPIAIYGMANQYRYCTPVKAM